MSEKRREPEPLLSGFRPRWKLFLEALEVNSFSDGCNSRLVLESQASWISFFSSKARSNEWDAFIPILTAYNIRVNMIPSSVERTPDPCSTQDFWLFKPINLNHVCHKLNSTAFQPIMFVLLDSTFFLVEREVDKIRGKNQRFLLARAINVGEIGVSIVTWALSRVCSALSRANAVSMFGCVEQLLNPSQLVLPRPFLKRK